VRSPGAAGSARGRDPDPAPAPGRGRARAGTCRPRRHGRRCRRQRRRRTRRQARQAVRARRRRCARRTSKAVARRPAPGAHAAQAPLAAGHGCAQHPALLNSVQEGAGRPAWALALQLAGAPQQGCALLLARRPRAQPEAWQARSRWSLARPQLAAAALRPSHAGQLALRWRPAQSVGRKPDCRIARRPKAALRAAPQHGVGLIACAPVGAPGRGLRCEQETVSEPAGPHCEYTSLPCVCAAWKTRQSPPRMRGLNSESARASQQQTLQTSVWSSKLSERVPHSACTAQGARATTQRNSLAMMNFGAQVLRQRWQASG